MRVRSRGGQVRRPLTALLLVLTTTAAGSSRAAVLCVNTDGSGGCFTSVTDAVAAVGAGDEIEVAAGTYAEPEITLVHGPRIRIRGAGVGATVIQSSGGFHISGQGARLSLTDLTVSGPAGGDAIRAGFTSRLELLRVEITGAENGIATSGGRSPSRATIVESTIHGNSGDGIRLIDIVRISRSLIHSNGGRGMWKGTAGNARIEDSTISGNGGPGLELAGRVVLRRSTIVGSSALDGGALHVSNGAGSARVEASILTDEAGGVGGLPDVRIVGGRVISNGYNLIKDPPVASTLTGRTSLDVVGVDPLLGPLQDNGGSTSTHALSVGSPALEVVVRMPACRRPDQRGNTREPRPCDIGAFEAP